MGTGSSREKRIKTTAHYEFLTSCPGTDSIFINFRHYTEASNSCHIPAAPDFGPSRTRTIRTQRRRRNVCPRHEFNLNVLVFQPEAHPQHQPATYNSGRKLWRPLLRYWTCNQRTMSLWAWAQTSHSRRRMYHLSVWPHSKHAFKLQWFENVLPI